MPRGWRMVLIAAIAVMLCYLLAAYLLVSRALTEAAENAAGSSSDALQRLERSNRRRLDHDDRLRTQGYPSGCVVRVFGARQQGMLLVATLDATRHGSPMLVSLDARGHLWRSPDSGSTWREAANGLRAPWARVFDIVEDPARGWMYLATEDGVCKSDTMGGSWQRFSEGLPYEHHEHLRPSVYRLSLDPSTGDLYARVPLDGFGIYRTGCDAPHWQDIGGGLPGQSITTDVCFCPIDDSVYIVNGCHGVRLLQSTDLHMGVYRLDSGLWGPRWVREESPVKSRHLEPANSLHFDPNAGELYACTRHGLFRRSAGAWHAVVSNPFCLSVVFELGGSRRALLLAAEGVYLRAQNRWAMLPTTPWHPDATVTDMLLWNDALWIGTNEGLFVSRDNGVHWARVALPAAISARDTNSRPHA